MNARDESTLGANALRVAYDGPDELAAGSRAHFAYRIESPVALPRGAQIGLARRWPSDWGTPQAIDPAAPDYVAIAAVPGRQFRWWTARLHAWHPFDHVLFVELLDGLDANEPLRMAFGGDAASGGFTVQTFIEEASPLAIRARRSTDEEWIEIARPAVRIVGAAPHRVVLTAPSRVSAGGDFSLHVRVEDVWGNPAQLATPVHLEAPFDRDIAVGDEGWTRVGVRIDAVGVHRIGGHAIIDGTTSFAQSNPVEVVAGPVTELLCWGDLHAQSVIGCGARSIDAYYRHARDFAATDFGSHQANCFLVSNDEWCETQSVTKALHEDGRFVALLGVEWSGASAYGGDHNLYFPGEAAELRRCSHEFVADKSDVASDLPHVTAVHDHYRGSDTLVAVHVGGRTADLRWHEPTLDRLLEVHSTHATSDWFLFDALKRGYRMGVVAGSDSVDGRPGASHPGHMGVRNVRGGLTAAALPALSRSALWDALRARHCYGTTGPRILLQLTAGDARMGDETTVASLPPFDVAIEGTAPIETLEFFRDDALLATIDAMAATTELSSTIRVAWSGTTSPGNWQRARMRWDGELRVTGARIVGAADWATDTPDEGVRERSDSRVAFRSITAGDWDGLLLELDDPARAELTFVTEPMALHARLGDLGTQARTFEAHSPERKVELRRMPRTMPALGWRGRFVDPSPPAGPHAYWIRVRQADGHFAWSTPIFTTLVAGS